MSRACSTTMVCKSGAETWAEAGWIHRSTEGSWLGPVPSPAPIIRAPVGDPSSNGLTAQDQESTGRFTASDSQHQQRGSGMSINEIKTTVFGFMGTQPTRLGQPGSTPVCSFRLGSTPAYYDTAAGVWKRKSTTWLTVKAFRTLAVNALACLHKGDPVIVSGSLVTEEWTSDGQPHSSLVLVADGIGHDLARGQDTFTRIRSGDASIDEGADGPDPWTTPPSSSPSETGSAPASSVSSADDRTSVENSNAG